MNPYDVLGVSQTADQAEIKSAWRKLSLELHPDRNSDPAAGERLREVNGAYELVKTPEKRAEYDRRASRSNSHHGFGDNFNSADFMYSHFADLFRKQQVSKSFNINVELPIDEVVTGKRITTKLNVDGEEIDIDFAIPAGVPEMARFNIKQFKSKSGLDVTISATVVTIQERNRQRHGNDLLFIQTISALDAILGTEIDIEPLAGQKIKLKIPKGTQPETKLIMRGVGLPIFNRPERGNIIAIVKIVIPTDLTDEQLDILSKMR